MSLIARRLWSLACLLALSACHARPEPLVQTCAGVPGTQLPQKPRLIVQITVDQLRADLPVRMLERFGAAGFRRLYESGVSFDDAHYTHTITETAVGHATLATGALPRDHGIVGNDWYDRAQKSTVYAVDDPSVTLLGASGPGRSAHYLLVPTLGDVLREQSKNAALVVAVSSKDRAAILSAGHGGQAFWLDDASGRFVTSSYYGERPAWIDQRAEAFSVERFRGKSWTLSQPEASYRARDDNPWERGYKQLGRTFPHPLDAAETKDFVKGLKYTPFADEMLLDFVRELLAQEPLGQDDVTDLLSVSFSATDYVGHAFGPESREAEDNLIRLDATLAKLFEVLLAHVPQAQLVVVLSADHGIAESPEWFQSQGQDAGRDDPAQFVPQLNAALRARLHIDADLVQAFVNPTLWLDEAKLAQLGLQLPDVEHALVQAVLAQPGFSAAFARSDLLAGTVPEASLAGPRALSRSPVSDELAQRVAASIHPERSGNVYVVPKEHWLLAGDPRDLAAMHGTPFPYDSSVPMVFWGLALAPQHVKRPVDPRDIAPTLSALARVPAPSGATGRRLFELVP
jgi:predicted AlkP superfamily pyrophosphatase or phosphodiesterase